METNEQQQGLEAQDQSFFQTMDSVSAWQETLNEAQQQGDSGFFVESGQPQSEQAAIEPAAQEAVTPDASQEEQKGFNPEDLPDHMSPEHAYGMAKYMQSEMDKAKAQNQLLLQELENVRATNPIGKLMTDDPNFLAHVAQYMGNSSSGQPGQAVAGTPSQESLQKPVAPSRPANMDPYAEDGQKYMEELLKYNEDLANYNNAIMEQRLGTIETYEVQKREEALRQQKVLEAYNTAKFQYGLNDVQAQEFIKWADDPQTANDIGVWVAAFKATRGVNTNGQNGHKPQGVAQRVQQHQQTAAGAQGSQQAPITPGDSFFVEAPQRPSW